VKILPIDACLLPLSLSPPPPPPPNTATMTTSILPRDVFFLKIPIVSSAITRTRTRNSTQRVLPLRFQFDFPEPRLSYIIDSCSVLEHEFETPRSKSDATQLTFDDLERALLTSPLSAIRPVLWISKCGPAFPSLWMASFLPITQTKLTQSILHLQLAFDDPEPTPLTSPFSVDSPLTLDLKLEALRSKTSKTFFPLEKKRWKRNDTSSSSSYYEYL